MFGINFNFLEGLNHPAPRYTSYPTIPEWSTEHNEYATELAFQKLKENPEEPLSLYFHIPFCSKLCLYCACSMLIAQNKQTIPSYIDSLIKEIQLVRTLLQNKRIVSRIHFGGGTPTLLSNELFSKLFHHIHENFDLSKIQEINIEVDPRSLENNLEKADFLKSIGFNRISLGVQDTNFEVQKAVHRNQSHEQTLLTYHKFRELGFQGLNIDLIYGLPKQTIASFQQTARDILNMKPDRIALFSFASVPWIKPHQKKLEEKDLPSMEEKFKMYSQTRNLFIQSGYQAIGMDHFALPHDELAIALKNKTLIRNFQGYSLPPEEDLLGFGITSTSFIKGIYLQKSKTIKQYQTAINQKIIPSIKNKILSKDDIIRKWVIHTLMCSFEICKNSFFEKFGEQFDHYFQSSLNRLQGMESSGLILNSPSKLKVTAIGELFVRVIATAFDFYFLTKTMQKPTFSQSI